MFSSQHWLISSAELKINVFQIQGPLLRNRIFPKSARAGLIPSRCHGLASVREELRCCALIVLFVFCSCCWHLEVSTRCCQKVCCCQASDQAYCLSFGFVDIHKSSRVAACLRSFRQRAGIGVVSSPLELSLHTIEWPVSRHAAKPVIQQASLFYSSCVGSLVSFNEHKNSRVVACEASVGSLFSARAFTHDRVFGCHFCLHPCVVCFIL